MGRRSQHTPEELRELILEATRRVVEQDGISQPSAREIARAIGYAPGTLYNMFENLGDILLHVEARILAELDCAIAAAIKGEMGRDEVRQFVDAYVDFACRNSRLWSLITQHQPDQTVSIPEWYREQVRAPQVRLGEILSRTFPGSNADDTSRVAQGMWTALHGLIQVAMTSKFGTLPRPAIAKMAQDLIEGMLSNYGRTVDPKRTARHSDNRPASAAE